MSTQEKQTSARREPPRSISLDQQSDVHPWDDLVAYAKSYSRQKPEAAALACIALGFILGWKLKPW